MRSSKGGNCLLEIEFTLMYGKRREFNRSFDDLHGHEGKGHIRTSVFEDCEEPGRMIWVAVWADRETLERYVAGERFGVLLGGLSVLSTVTDCRVLDEVVTGGQESSPIGRALDERRFIRMVLKKTDPLPLKEPG